MKVMAPPTTPDWSLPDLCVVNFNGRRYLPRTLGRIRELRGQFNEVIIVDDASTDGSALLASELLPEGRVLRLAENRGPSVARNAGFAALRADRVLFMDNDVVLEPDALPRLMEALDQYPAAVIALPRIVSDIDPDRTEYEGGDAHVSGLLILRGAEARGSTAPPRPSHPVGSMSACAFLLDRARWGNAPPFEPLVRMYFEDHEFGLRARILGYELLAVPAAVGRHGLGTPGISIRETGRPTPFRIRQTILNRWLLIAKLYQARTLLAMAPSLVLFEAFQLIGSLALGWGGHWGWAARELLRRLPALRRERIALQKVRKRPDAALLVAGPHPLNPALRHRFVVGTFVRVLDAITDANWRFVGAHPHRHAGL